MRNMQEGFQEQSSYEATQNRCSLQSFLHDLQQDGQPTLHEIAHEIASAAWQSLRVRSLRTQIEAEVLALKTHQSYLLIRSS